MLLYKYRQPINLANPDACNTAKIFNNSALYFAKPSSFNDPFEGIISLDTSQTKAEAMDRHFRVLRTRERARDVYNPIMTTWQNSQRNIDKIYDRVISDQYIDHEKYYKDVMDENGVLSLCEIPDNLLLWAHYAHEHRGMCIGFEWDETTLPEAKQVIYQTNYRSLDYWSHTEDELAEIALLQKSSDWSYERERRSVFKSTYSYYQNYEPNQECLNKLKEAEDGDYGEFLINRIKEDYTYTYRKIENSGVGPKAFKKDSIKEVIFGSRMDRPQIDSHIKFIESLGYNPHFKIAKKDKSQYRLRIENA